MTHRSRKSPLRLPPGANISRVVGTVAPKILEAKQIADEALSKLGIKHTLVGGLAVGAHGYPRLTDDVDFLVSEDAYVHHGPIVSPRPGLPFSVKGVNIDNVSLGPGERKVLKRFLKTSTSGAIIPIEGLVFMKLHAGRSQDDADLIGIFKRVEVDLDRIRTFILTHAPHLSFRLDEMILRAKGES